jgi:hypothetical protein
MVRPVLLAVDDEPAARSSIEKELRKRYGADHEVICEGSGAAALGVLGRVGATTEQLPVVVTFDGLGAARPLLRRDRRGAVGPDPTGRGHL